MANQRSKARTMMHREGYGKHAKALTADITGRSPGGGIPMPAPETQAPSPGGMGAAPDGGGMGAMAGGQPGGATPGLKRGGRVC